MTARAVSFTIAAALAAAGCSDPLPCSSGTCEDRVAVGQYITFGVEEPEGVTPGFDLDDLVSSGDDFESCRQPDFVAPDGTRGIDNQFALLWAAITDIIGDAADGLLMGAINDGNLLMMVRFEGIDDLEYDDCVDVSVFLGEGKPFIGTDGLITSGQTFDVAPDTPMSRVACAVLEDGVVTTDHFDGVIPISILDVSFDLEIYQARLRAELHDDGSITATIGAGVSVDQVIEVAEGADYRLEGLVSTLVRNRADLAPDEYGECQRMSATLLVDGTRAFLYEDSAP